MKYALITGASKGIGKAMAEELASKGWNLLLVARSSSLLEAVAVSLKEKYKIEADYLALDLAKPGASQLVYDWVQQKGVRIQALLNNAGYGLSGPFDKYSMQDNQDMMQVNMNTLIQLVNLFLPQLKQESRSYILNIASSAAYQAIPYLSLYSATKAFVLSFSRGLKQELRGSSVSVTCVCPGPTDTDFASRAQVGAKGVKAAEKFNMSPEAVAKIAVESMLNGKTEVITGFVNKLSASFAWLLPKSLVERTAMKIYE
jgi:short-subunit dehydrogenase